ncbi:MAG: 16S rRNA (guanine(966)-N(2))-methyltransferase RsmD [Lachnospiraceae bacterium]|jgi:16S rRNA (guanine966-N2)-methyltransferase|nr:16S rRNA (guanine(966)-N(2))-methyltransferase RsmD [Lachnospiraceae bacterium]
MRVIAGSARRLLLVTPEGTDTRPTQDRIKETLFNMIHTQIPGTVFLDLCAGSGGIGIEALSRGARRAYFVENRQDAVKCIQENLHRTHFEEASVVLKQDVLNAIMNIHEKQADLIYIDPPYESGLQKKILARLASVPYVTEESVIILETALDADLSFTERLGFIVEREKRYKTNEHVFLRRKAVHDEGSDLSGKL